MLFARKKYLLFLTPFFLLVTFCAQTNEPVDISPVQMDNMINVPWFLHKIMPASPAGAVEEMRPLMIVFDTDTSLFGYNGCNRFSGRINIRNDSLITHGFWSNLLGCYPENFYEACQLLKTSAIRIANGHLEMWHEDTVLVFESKFYAPLPAYSFLNDTLRLISSNDPHIARLDSLGFQPRAVFKTDRTYLLTWSDLYDSGIFTNRMSGVYGMNKNGDFIIASHWGGYHYVSYTSFAWSLIRAKHYKYKSGVLKIENRKNGYYYEFKP